jgi:hypothetical protein
MGNDRALERGAHKSATSEESIALVQEDVAYQLKAGYAEVIAWKDLQKLRPKQLEISPLAVVPQHKRRGRMILDLSFAVRARRTNQKENKRGQTKRGRKRKRKPNGDRPKGDRPKRDASATVAETIETFPLYCGQTTACSTNDLHYTGYCDASASGVRGVWFGADRDLTPLVWRVQGLAMRQRTTHAAPPAVLHVAGVRNTLADVASRVIPGVPSMETTPGSVCPVKFLSHFDSSYPLQQLSWTNVRPTSDLWSNVIMTLRGLQLPLQRWATSHAKAFSTTGLPIPELVATTRGFEATVKPSSKNAFCPLPPGFELESSARTTS